MELRHHVFFAVSPLDTVLYTAREKEKPYGPDQDDPEVVQPYAAYAPAGHPQVHSNILWSNTVEPGEQFRI